MTIVTAEGSARNGDGSGFGFWVPGVGFWDLNIFHFHLVVG
jgi:hypothetical protein